jgi:hypothetical protein
MDSGSLSKYRDFKSYANAIFRFFTRMWKEVKEQERIEKK